MSTDAADPIARLQAAVAAHRAGRLDEAEQQYRAVLEHEPENPNALHLLGVVYRQRGRPETAAALITQALQYAPALADAHANLGNVYSDMQLFDAAVQAYDNARKLGSRGPDSDRRLLAALEAAAAAHRADGRPQQAREYLQRALTEAPQRVEVMRALLPYYLEEDKLEALVLAARAWRLAPDPATFRILWDLNNRAGDDLDRAHAFLAEQPDDPFRMIVAANALRRARRGWEAEALYRQAIDAAPDQPFASMRLACLLLEQGRTGAAEEWFRRAEQTDPGRVQAIQFGAGFFRKLRRRPLPLPPAGFVPPPPSSEPVVFAACDGTYFDRFASALLNSTHRNSGLRCRFHLHVVNPPPDILDRLDACKAMLDGAEVVVSTEQVDVSDWGDEKRRTWFACTRFRLLPHLMEAYSAPILMVDTDLIVLRDLGGLLEAACAGDVAAVATERHVCEPWNWFWADVVFFNATPAALAFADLVARYIDHHLAADEAHWFLDQIALTACLMAGFQEGPAPRFVALPTDIHRLSLICKDGADEPPGPHVLFWSAHASTVDTALTLGMPRYQDYVLPWPPTERATPEAASAIDTPDLADQTEIPLAAE